MEWGLQFLGIIQIILSWIFWPIHVVFSLTKSPRLPPMKSELLSISATKLAEKIRTQQIKSIDVVDAYIQRITEVNPALNAVIQERFEAARHDARRIDSQISSRELSPMQIKEKLPLLGVPFTVKESCAVAGMSLSGGSLARVGTRAIQDGETVGLLRAAGGIPLVVTNTPEYCLNWETYNNVFGKTRNPYDLKRTPGGSSGGEGALIGAGASCIGVASDIAGSIRIPAMYNGIFGHKPTSGIISINGHFPNSSDVNFQQYLTIGPLVRYAEDLTIMVGIMSGKNSSKLGLNDKVNLKELNVLYMIDAGKSIVLVPVDQSIKDVTKKAVDHLSICCDSVKDANFSEMVTSIEFSCSLFFGMSDVPDLLRDANIKSSFYLELAKGFAGFSTFTLPSLLFYLLQKTNVFIPRSKYQHYKEKSMELRKKFVDTLGTTGVFLYPTFPSCAVYHYETFMKMAGVMYTMVFNIMGLPSTHVPLGLDNNGMPIGIQVVAAPYQDRLCIAVAKELERAFGGWVPPPAAS